MHTPLPPFNPRVADLGSSPVRALFGLARSPGMISFAGGQPAEELFDSQGISEAYVHVLDQMPFRALQYASTEGEIELREIVAWNLSNRGMPSIYDDILITSGSQQGLGLLGQTILEEDAVILVENPTYVSAIQAFKIQGARFVPVETDDDGMVPSALQAAIEEHDPRAVYMIPTFQNPTGISMSAARRKAIADVLAEHHIWLIEDDPYSELRFDGEQADPISSDERIRERSFYLGSLSKVLAPGLRIGWIRGPREALDNISVAKQATCLQTSTVDQLAAARYLEVNDIQEKLIPVREEYKARRDTMVEALAPVLPEGSHLNSPRGGMFLWATLPEDVDTSRLVYSAIEAGVIYIPGPSFYVDEGKPNTMRLSFVSNPLDRVVEGIRRLATVL